MQSVFEKIKDRLKERSQWHQVYGDVEGLSYMAYDSAIEIVNQVEEECENSAQVSKHLDGLHSKILKNKFAEDVTEAEIEALVKAKVLTNINQSLTNDGWIPCNERMPEEHMDKELHMASDLVQVTMIDEDGNSYVLDDCTLDGEWCNAGDLFEVIAWQPLPAPYPPKGE